jgi:hypothetical protein
MIIAKKILMYTCEMSTTLLHALVFLEYRKCTMIG